ncbi:unnamed protein product, partial [Didymodactylos carnosus]
GSGPLADLLAKFLRRNPIKESCGISGKRLINDMEYQPEDDDYLKNGEIENFGPEV